ncbi:olfactory receptor 52E8-like [Rana temporaria]|uniref:olfactory receptor 52E8-like n=1 Tax=Rana temporaria TaxID=8407 RepID=UPI001AAD1959|nr:olfactory receptor 52E8-like [Rana temporaria]
MEGLTQNETTISYTEFVLFGFPGVIKYRKLLMIPFMFIYVVILSGNILIIHRVFVEPSLHSPMYFLVNLLFAVNISSTTAVLPKFLLGLSFNSNQITLSGCLSQMFYIYFMAIFESGVILSMALDRFIAICRPLRYNDIMTTGLLVQLALIGVVRSVLLVSPMVVLTSSVRFCRSNVILNFVCENMGLLSLACEDISQQQAVGLMVRILVTVVDVSLLLLSYSTIVYTAMKIAVGKARHKALHTCGAHLTVAMIIYLSALISSVVYRMHTYVSYDIQNLFNALYLMIPASLNPFIYGLGVKEIRRCLTRSWRNKTTIVSSSSMHIRVNKTFVFRVLAKKKEEN